MCTRLIQACGGFQRDNEVLTAAPPPLRLDSVIKSFCHIITETSTLACVQDKLKPVVAYKCNEMNGVLGHLCAHIGKYR